VATLRGVTGKTNDVSVGDIQKAFRTSINSLGRTNVGVGNLATTSVIRQPVSIPVTFPKFFSKTLGAYGGKLEKGVSKQSPLSVPMISNVEASSGQTLPQISTAFNDFKARNLRHMLQYAKGEGGISEEQCKEIQETLENLVASYSNKG